MIRRYALFVAAGVFAAGLPASAADSGGWRGGNGAGSHPETGLLERWPEGGPKLLWQYPAAGEPLWMMHPKFPGQMGIQADGIGVAFSTVNVCGKTVYLTGNHFDDGRKIMYAKAFTLDGKLKWSTRCGRCFGNGRYEGPRATPEVDGTSVYATTAHAVVYCLDAETGQIRWSVDTTKRFAHKLCGWGYNVSPLLAGDHLIVPIRRGNVALAALDKRTGETAWTAGPGGKYAWVDSSPVVLRTRSSSLVVWDTYTGLLAFDVAARELVWEGESKSPGSLTPIQHDGRVLATMGSRLHCFAPADDGKSLREVWKGPGVDGIAQCSVLDGKVFAGGGRKLICSDFATGRTLMEKPFPWIVRSMVAADGMLYVIESDNRAPGNGKGRFADKARISLVKPAPEGFDVVSSFEPVQGTKEVYVGPTIAEGRLFHRHGNLLAVYDIADRRDSGGPTVQRSPAADARLLTDFSADLPRDMSNAVLALRLQEVRPIHESAVATMDVYLHRIDGSWATNESAVGSDHNYRMLEVATVEAPAVTARADRVVGRLTIDTSGGRKSKRPADRLDVEFSVAIDAETPLPHQPDLRPSMPPWKKAIRPFGGHSATGRYAAVFTRGSLQGKTVQGDVVGALNHRPVKGVWGATGNATLVPAAGGGMRVTARLSPKRVMPPESAWAELQFAGPQDWRRYDGLRITVQADSRRDDAAVAIALRESSGLVTLTEWKADDGAWYSVTSAAFLRESETAFEVPFADFRGEGDDNYALDVDAVAALRVGVDDPRGVGDVAFTVRRIELYGDGGAFAGLAPLPVQVAVDTEHILSLNGATNVPAGLCGVHDAGVIWWFKHGPEKPEPKAYFDQLNLGLMRTASGPLRPRAVAAMEKLGRPLKGISCDHLWTWSRPAFMDAEDPGAWAEGWGGGYANRAVEGRGPDDQPAWEVSNESFMWARYANAGNHLPRKGQRDFADPTQYGYLPAQRIADVYSKMFLSAWDAANGKGRKRLRLVGPSSHAFNNDDYAHFRMYVAPIIDACHDKLDFLTEHRYGACPESYAASWEVAKAYCVLKHGRSIPICNTECNDCDFWDANRAHYNLADILACMRVCPDVSYGRAMHAFSGTYMGSAGEHAFFMLLNTLRGALLPLEISDEALLGAASLTSGGKVVAVLFNPTSHSRTLSLQCPAGYTLTEWWRLRLGKAAEEKCEDVAEAIALYPPPDATNCVLEAVQIPDAADEEAGVWCVETPARSAMRCTWTPKPDTPRPARLLRRRQAFWEKLFVDVRGADAVTGEVVWRDIDPQAKRAWLRVITRDVHRGEAEAVLNGTGIPLPWSSSNDGYALAQDIEISPDLLKPQTRLVMRRTDPDHGNGFTVYAASVIVE